MRIACLRAHLDGKGIIQITFLLQNTGDGNWFRGWLCSPCGTLTCCLSEHPVAPRGRAWVPSVVHLQENKTTATLWELPTCFKSKHKQCSRTKRCHFMSKNWINPTKPKVRLLFFFPPFLDATLLLGYNDFSAFVMLETQGIFKKPRASWPCGFPLLDRSAGLLVFFARGCEACQPGVCAC